MSCAFGALGTVLFTGLNLVALPLVDLHWFFEIFIRTEVQLVYTEFFFQFKLRTEQKLLPDSLTSLSPW